MSDEQPSTGLRVANGSYPIEKKLEVVNMYLQLGNMRLISELTKISYDLLIDWKKTKWWAELYDEVKRAKSSKTNNTVNSIIETSLDAISDRLENGEWILNQKTGEMVRKPVSLRDAARVASDLRSQQIKLDELEARITHQNDTVEGTLKTLAKEFARWAKKPLPGDVVDVETVEVKDAVHEERSTNG